MTSARKSEKAKAVEDSGAPPPATSTFSLAQLAAAIELIREQEAVMAQVAVARNAPSSASAQAAVSSSSEREGEAGHSTRVYPEVVVAPDDSDEEYWANDSFDEESLRQVLALEQASSAAGPPAAQIDTAEVGGSIVAPAAAVVDVAAIAITGPTVAPTAGPAVAPTAGPAVAPTAVIANVPGATTAPPPTYAAVGAPPVTVVPILAVDPSTRWYSVTRGLDVGIFHSWANTSPLVTGVSGAIFTRFSSQAQANAAYAHALAQGLVEHVIG